MTPSEPLVPSPPPLANPCQCTDKRHKGVRCIRFAEPGTDVCMACIHVCMP